MHFPLHITQPPVLSEFMRGCSVASVLSDSLLPHGLQEYWKGLPLALPGDFPNPEIEPASLESPALQEDSFPLSHQGSPW